jgi:hypothetical protein
VSSHASPVSLSETRSRPRGAYAVSALGPLTVAGGLVWAVLQPYRLTLLHPFHQGFWWLVIEPPLLVAAAGIIFALVVARPLIADLEARDAAPR